MAELPPSVTSSDASKPPTGAIPPSPKPALPINAKPGDPNNPEEPLVHELGFWQKKWVQIAVPLATSFAVHLGILIVGIILLLAMHVIRLPSPYTDQINIPDASLATDDQLGGIPNPGMGVDPNKQAAQDTDPNSATKGWAETKTDISKQLEGGGATGGDVIAAGEGTGPGSGQNTGGGIGKGLGVGSGTGGGEEAAFGPRSAGGPPGPASKIFGHGSRNKSIIYICDGSGSLVGGKDEALRVELKRAVAHLSPIQAFNVLIFQESEGNKQYLALDNQVLMANPNNISKLYNLVDNRLTFHGTTNPVPALEEAWREGPELVYLLTDGEFDDPDSATVMAKIKELNDARKHHGQALIKVDTVLLVEKRNESYPEFETLMKKIADDSGGVYVKRAAEDLD